MICPFVVHILFGWTSNGDRIPLIFFLQIKTTFVKSCVLYIGVECLPESTLLVMIGANTIVGSMILSAL
jgi:hypothetical protein